VLLRNLIDNAVRHGGPPGPVEVHCRRDDHGVVLKVADHGPGVVRDEIESLGRRFFRASGASGPGSGLGLSIVQRIAEHFGGTVSYRRGPDDRGLTVELRFPSAPFS
jgi:two-component system sensor histidine kinase QseC